MCAGRRERSRIERREKQFAVGDRRRFRQRMVSKCAKLSVNGRLVRDPDEMMDVWCQHFRSLGESRASELAELRELTDKIDSLAAKSFENEEFILDVPFTEDEVSNAVKRLKVHKAAGPDGVLAEHLKEGGYVVI